MQTKQRQLDAAKKKKNKKMQQWWEKMLQAFSGCFAWAAEDDDRKKKKIQKNGKDNQNVFPCTFSGFVQRFSGFTVCDEFFFCKSNLNAKEKKKSSNEKTNVDTVHKKIMLPDGGGIFIRISAIHCCFSLSYYVFVCATWPKTPFNERRLKFAANICTK